MESSGVERRDWLGERERVIVSTSINNSNEQIDAHKMAPHHTTQEVIVLITYHLPLPFFVSPGFSACAVWCRRRSSFPSSQLNRDRSQLTTRFDIDRFHSFNNDTNRHRERLQLTYIHATHSYRLCTNVQFAPELHPALPRDCPDRFCVMSSESDHQRNTQLLNGQRREERASTACTI